MAQKNDRFKFSYEKYGDKKKVCVLLATYNGSEYLRQQLKSISIQREVSVYLVVVDDCSSKKERSLLRQELSAVNIPFKLLINKQQIGPANNFMKAVIEAENSFDYYAFADQDDVWLENKLINAIEVLEQFQASDPSLYCGRTELVNEELKHIGMSPLKRKSPSFQHALAQSIAGGNTMVFNKPAKLIIEMTAKTSTDFVAHDWWCYILISGVGGNVYYDPSPKILYRQHMNNVLGSNSGFVNTSKRAKYLLTNIFKSWNDSNEINFELNSNLFTEKNLMIGRTFFKNRKGNIFQRLHAAFPVIMQRETAAGKVGFLVGAVLGKI